MIAKAAGTEYTRCMQYTVRNVPEGLDAALRERARREHRSLNEVVVEALARGMGFTRDKVRHRDMSDVAETWREDPAFDEAVTDQHRIDEDIWK